MNNDNIENKIIQAAREIFIEKGYDCTSMSDIATKAGINRPSLHYYFRTKERMFQAVFHSIISNLLPSIQEIIESDNDFFDKMSKALDQYIITFKNNPDIPAFIFKEMQRDVNLLIQTAHEIHLNIVIKKLSQCLQNEMNAGNLRQVKQETAFCTFYGLLSFPFISRNLIKNILFDNKSEMYDEFLENWKTNVIDQMKALLQPESANTSRPA